MNISALFAGQGIAMPGSRVRQLLILHKKSVCWFMRLSFVTLLPLFCTINMLLARDVKGQDMNRIKVKLEIKHSSLIETLKKVQRRTPFSFAYNSKDLAGIMIDDFPLEERTVKETLDILLQHTSLQYEQVAGNIVISAKPAIPAVGTFESVSAEGNQDGWLRMEITGTVRNENGMPMAGVSVTVQNTQNGTVTDEAGRFKLTVEEKKVILEFSYVGYESQSREVQGSDPVAIVLKEATSGLNEVVVVGYGTTKKETLTGSVATLKMSSKENMPITNASQALHGVSGMWVNQAGSQPGQDAASIRIRGIGSIGEAGKNNPIVLVDGIEYDLNAINPAFIENITVLKDASAAIYGSRAANGVILITTKKGRKGKSDINYSYSYGRQSPTMLPDVVWDPILYMQLKDQALINEGRSPAAVDYSPAQIEEYRNGIVTDPLIYPQNNWFDIILKTGYIQQHNVRFSGGSDAVVYNIGVGYMDQDGILIQANHANRYTLNANISANVTSKLKIGTSIIGNYKTYSQPAFGGANATNYYFNRLTRALPIFGTYTADGKYSSVAFVTPKRNTIENPLMLIKEGSNAYAGQSILAKIEATYELPFNLKYNLNYGVDKEDAFRKSFEPYLVSYHPITGVPNNYNIHPSSNNADENYLNQSFYQTLTWDRTFAKKHSLSAMAGTSYNNFNTINFSSHIEGYFDNELTDLNAGSTLPSVTGQITKNIIVSYLGRLNYGFADKYLLEGTFRYDGSSRFASNRRWGFFPAVSAAWRIDKENFLEDVPFIDLLKLRGSWGKMGNQDAVNLYSYLNTVNLGYDYTFANNISSGAAIVAYNDPNITWETTTTYNAGLDIDLFKNRLGVVLDVFKRRTSDIIRTVKIPNQVGGLAGPTRNIGTVDNTGYEISLIYRNKINQFSYELAGNVSHVNNKVIDLRGEKIISTRRITQEGYPIDSYYLYKAIGIYQDQDEINSSANLGAGVRPGYLKYEDISGPEGVPDGKIDAYDRIITGVSSPKYNYSFNLNLGYKGFSLSTFFQGVQGIDLYPTLNWAVPFNNGAGVTKEWATDAWTPQNPNARLPILTVATDATENFQPSTFWLKNGSYLRLKNIQLKYDLPQKWVSRISMKNISFFANGENLVTFSKYKDFDPEKDVTGDSFYEYPTLKTFSFGINATF